MQTPQRYWFPARSYGWRWGFPNGRDGWLVLAVYGLLVVVGIVFIPPTTERELFTAYMLCLLAALIFVCWLKGEPPKWRWGKKDGR